MFSKYVSNYFTDVEKAARDSKNVIQYDNIPVYECILRYCKNNKLYISNVDSMVASTETTTSDTTRAANHQSDKKTPSTTTASAKAYSSDIMRYFNMHNNPMVTFIIYGEFIFRHANRLANELAEKHTIYVELVTTIKDRIFSMKVNGDPRMLLFYNIHRDHIGAINAIKGRWLPPKLEMITINHKLYSPQHYGDLGDLLRQEAQCWKIYCRRVNPQPLNRKKTYPYNSIVMTWLKNRVDCILVGPMATTYPHRTNHKIQIITCMNVGQASDELKQLLKKLAGVVASTRTYTVTNIPGEYRMTKTLVSHKGNHLIEVYNTPSYELVPYTVVDNIQVGTEHVLIYHMLLDSWLVSVLGSSGKLPSSMAERIVASNAHVIQHIKKAARRQRGDATRPEFMGVYHDDFLAKKRVSLSNTYRRYYPAQYKKTNGSYRTI